VTKPNDYLWPRSTCLTFYTKGGRSLVSIRRRKFDLYDALMQRHRYRTAYLGIATRSDSWPRWTNEALDRIEARIRYDFEFESFSAKLTRMTPVVQPAQPCTEEFRWRLQVRPRWR
jgi:hypothetical protein